MAKDTTCTTCGRGMLEEKKDGPSFCINSKCPRYLRTNEEAPRETEAKA